MTTSTRKRARRAVPLEQALHPDVADWLRQRATARHGGDLAAAAAALVERSYLHAHPEHGPCSKCGARTYYQDATRRCRRCAS